MYRWLIFLHLVGAFGFMLGHGATVNIMFRLRQEKEVAQVRALIELGRSRWVQLVSWISFLLLLASGITMGFMGSWWGEGWIWTSLGILVVLILSMGYFGRGYIDPILNALGLPQYEGQEPTTEAQTLSEDELQALLQAGRPWLLTISGVLGWALVLWLMMFKPF